jgi:UDP-N-acetylglucosamine:LPS N-acetylglucosamine transferase
MSNAKNKNCKLLVFTGGHHTSGLVVAQEARRRGWNIIWVGHKYSMAKDQNLTAEYREVTACKIPFYELKAGKIFTSRNFLSFFKVFIGLFQSLFLLRQLKSDYTPIPWSSRGEQLANAQFLASAGRAVILPQPDLTYSSLMQAIAAAISLKPLPLSLPKNGTENLVNLIDQTFI